VGFRRLTLVAACILVAALAACGGDDDRGDDTADGGDAITVVSDDFNEGDGVPLEFTCEGEDVSPSLSWSGVPADSRALAVVVDDPDADGFIHWMVFDIPPDVTDLPTAIAPDETIEAGGTHATNDFGNLGYGGPCPPEGEEHTYRFRVLATDIDLRLDPGTPAGEILPQLEARLLGEGALTAKFAR
jgi:Raf kinase inhibitor-like YbhB/YbcL family protein